MFVLCPHCHFLVGIDPRTGKPPATCPKCGGLVVEPLPDMPAQSTHAEEVPAVDATPLAPFAPVELPSILPTLPETTPESEPEPVQDPETKRASVEPIIAEADASPAPVAPAALEPAATPALKPRWWSRRKVEPTKAATALPTAAIAPPATPTTASNAPTAMPAAQSGADAPRRADTMIAALQGRRRAPRKAAEPPPQSIPAPIPVPSAVAAVEVEVDALPPAVQINDVVATTAANAGLERSTATPAGVPVGAPVGAPAGTPAETPAAAPAKRTRQASAATTNAQADHPATIAPAIENTAAAVAPVVIAPADMPAAPHPLRRRTDFDPNATSEPVAGIPPHPLRRRTDAPSFTRPRARASAASRVGWRSLVAVGGLSLLLVLQLLLAQRDTLAASPRWRPTIASVCATLRCSLPPWHEPAAFTMLSRDVRPHPDAPGTLLINASFRNDARWPQPWPRLLLTLSDLDGRMVGARSFAVDEYLGAAPTQFELAPGQTAAVTLSVVEPAPNIVAFTFDFR